MDNVIVKQTVKGLQKIDRIYQSSPSAQMLVNHAPIILHEFRQLQALGMQYQHELTKLREERADRLIYLREIVPGIQQNLNQILETIISLQKSVRDWHGKDSTDSNIRLIIDHTNRQINQNIELFQNLTFQLLNA